MKQLDKTFVGKGEVKGFIFTQKIKKPYGYVYAVLPPNGRTHYEVFKHKENERFKCVSYPTSKSFGVWAWSFNDYKKAVQKLIELEDQQKKNSKNT